MRLLALAALTLAGREVRSIVPVSGDHPLADDEIPLGGQYAWERLERPGAPWHGWYRIRDVPVLSEGAAGSAHAEGMHDGHPAVEFFDSIDAAWLEAARANHATRARRDGWLPPLHVGHHMDSDVPAVRGAGLLVPRRVAMAQLEGRALATLVCDLLAYPDVFFAIKDGRLPYLSVEVHPRHFDREAALLHGCALLEHQPPEYKHPILSVMDLDTEVMTGDLGVAAANSPTGLAFATRRIFGGSMATSTATKNGTAKAEIDDLRRLATAATKANMPEEAKRFNALADAMAKAAEGESKDEGAGEASEMSELKALAKRVDELATLFAGLKASLTKIDEAGPTDSAPAAEESKDEKKDEAPETMPAAMEGDMEKKPMAASESGAPVAANAGLDLAAENAALRVRIATIEKNQATLAAAAAKASQEATAAKRFETYSAKLTGVDRALWADDLRAACAASETDAQRVTALVLRVHASRPTIAGVWDETLAAADAGADEPLLAPYTGHPAKLAAARAALEAWNTYPALRGTNKASYLAAYVERESE